MITLDGGELFWLLLVNLWVWDPAGRFKLFSSGMGTAAAYTALPAAPGSPDAATTDHENVFKGHTVITLDRNNCSPEEDAKLVALINNAYKSERVTLAEKTNPTARYFCLSDGVELLACAGYARGDEAVTSAPRGLTGSDCFIAPFAAVRGYGYGKTLLQRIEHVAKAEGFSNLTVHVWNEAPENMHPYYQAIGYKQDKTFKYLFGGQWASMTRYRRALSG